MLHTHWLICRLFVQKNGCNPTLSSKQFYCFGRFRRKKPNVSQSDRVRYLINKYVCYLISTDVAVLSSNYSPDLEHLTLRCCPFNFPQEFGCIYRADYECRMLMLWQFFMMAGDFKKKKHFLSYTWSWNFGPLLFKRACHSLGVSVLIFTVILYNQLKSANHNLYSSDIELFTFASRDQHKLHSCMLQMEILFDYQVNSSGLYCGSGWEVYMYMLIYFLMWNKFTIAMYWNMHYIWISTHSSCSPEAANFLVPHSKPTGVERFSL